LAKKLKKDQVGILRKFKTCKRDGADSENSAKKNRSKLLAASKACFHLVSVECRGGVVVQRAARPRVGAVDAVQAARENRRAVRCCWKALQSLAAEGIMHCYLLRYGHIRTWALRAHTHLSATFKLVTLSRFGYWAGQVENKGVYSLMQFKPLQGSNTFAGAARRKQTFPQFLPKFRAKKAFFFHSGKVSLNIKLGQRLDLLLLLGQRPQFSLEFAANFKNFTPTVSRESDRGSARHRSSVEARFIYTRALRANRSFLCVETIQEDLLGTLATQSFSLCPFYSLSVITKRDVKRPKIAAAVPVLR